MHSLDELRTPSGPHYWSGCHGLNNVKSTQGLYKEAILAFLLQ